MGLEMGMGYCELVSELRENEKERKNRGGAGGNTLIEGATNVRT